MSNLDINLFSDEEFEVVKLTPEKVVCLGMEFESDDARRAHFREELRKKLPELRQIEGFPIGEDEDIINLSDPPYYTACPNPWLNDFIAEWEQEKVELKKQGKRSVDFEVNEPYASDVKVGKNNPVYTAHTYHTKVPHPVIMRYILHYTQPGDIVFDGFAGTGMTGIAAQACGNPTIEDRGNIDVEWKQLFNSKPMWGKRHAIIGDLSPYAYSIAFDYNLPTNKLSLEREANRIYKELEKKISWMYQTYDEKGNMGLINYVVWSDYFYCNQCEKEFLYWDVAMDFKNECIADDYKCPHCGCIHNKKNRPIRVFESKYDNLLKSVISIAKSSPVLIVYTVNGVRKQKKPDSYDLSILEKIDQLEYSKFVPNYELPDGEKTREPKRTHGVSHVHLYNTKRNTIALSESLYLIENSTHSAELKFIFTGMINRSSKMNRIHVNNFFHGGGGWNAGHMKGTLYIPNIPVETSILEQFNDKLASYLRAIPYIGSSYNNAISIWSASKTPINSCSIDYIFTDPPFGANIMYSELNALVEPWLRLCTNNQYEAIENHVQGKDMAFYSTIMQNCFSEFYRILKPGKWMTVEFSNTKASIWNLIQNAISAAGFVISNVAALNKGQGGMRSISTKTGVKEDLAISCYKPSQCILEKKLLTSNDIWLFIEDHLNHLPIFIKKDNKMQINIERDQRILFDRLISYYVQNHYEIPINSVDFQRGLKDRFIERDEMFFTASQAIIYDNEKDKFDGFVPMALFISTEAEGIEWLKRELAEPQTYQEILPNWMKDMVAPKKGDVLPELAVILEENFIKDEDGKWRKPDAEKAADLEILRGKKLMKEFNLYLEQALKPKAKRMKDTRLEVLRYGFKECYKQKNYQAIVTVGDHIQESLLQEDEVLLQYYDIASMRV